MNDEPYAIPDPTAEAATLAAQNDAAIAALAAQGVQLDAVNLLGIRIMALMDNGFGPVIGPDGKGNFLRGQFELELQRQYAKLIEDVRSQITRARLLQGVQGVNHTLK